MKRSKVIVDARMVGRQGHGIARYIEGLLEALLPLERPYDVGLLVREERSDLLSLLAKKHQLELVVVTAPFLRASELWQVPRALAQSSADLFHSPSFSSYWSLPCPHVQTIHDLNHLRFGSRLDWIYYTCFVKKSAQSAAALMTVSEFSRSELAAWLEVSESRVRVIKNPVSLVPGSDSTLLAHHGLYERRYFLALLSSKPHKNLTLLLEAYASYRSTGGRWPLVLGSVEVDAPGVLTVRGTAEQVQGLMQSAGALLAPSLYEGYGRTPVEAFMAETPVIVSDIPSHREALGPMVGLEVLWVDPRSPGDWAAALRREAYAVPSDEARWLLQSEHDPAVQAKALDAVYRSVLGLEG